MFKKAIRQLAKLKLAITGPSGSGKTFTALLIALGIGGKIAVADTENGSASLYADMDKGPLAGVAFDTLTIEAPYTIDKYFAAIDEAVKAKYSVLIMDSISPEWAGDGGLLDKKGALDARGTGSSYTNWNVITPEHERFKAKILQADIHIICTMRSKQDYVLEQNEKGKSVPRKVGLAPIQREGIEYEFTTVFDLAMDHNAAVSKDRTSLFDGKIFKPTRKTGEELMAWLKSGKPAPKPVPATEAPKPAAAPETKVIAPDEFNSGPATPEQIAGIQAGTEALRKLGLAEAVILRGISGRVKKIHGIELNMAAISNIEAATIIEYLGKWVELLSIEAKPKALAPKKRAGK